MADEPAADDLTGVRGERFAAGLADVLLPQCSYCTRRVAGSSPTACAAFPAGVPAAVLRNKADHRKPIEGDNGLRFEGRSDVPAAQLRRLGAALGNGGKPLPPWAKGTA